MKRCIGFGEFEGICENKAGTDWSPHWCNRCNTLRIECIDKGFEKIKQKFKEKTGAEKRGWPWPL